MYTKIQTQRWMLLNTNRIDRALFTGLVVGVVLFISEFLLPETNSFVSILIGASAALIGYLIADKIWPTKEDI